MDSVQVLLLPLQAPPQPANLEPFAALALSITLVLASYEALQPVPQLMPLGLDVTVPLPLPLRLTVRTYWAGTNCAVTDLALSMETVHVLPAPVQAPLQPANVEPEVALAPRVTVVFAL